MLLVILNPVALKVIFEGLWGLDGSRVEVLYSPPDEACRCQERTLETWVGGLKAMKGQ